MAFTIWSPGHGVFFFTAMLLGTVVGPVIPLVKLLCMNFVVLSLIVSVLTVLPEGEANGASDGFVSLAERVGWLSIPLILGLTWVGFTLSSGSQTLWFQRRFWGEPFDGVCGLGL